MRRLAWAVMGLFLVGSTAVGCAHMPRWAGGGWTTLLDGADGSSMTVARMAMCVGLAFQDPDGQIFAARVSEEVGFGARNAGASGRHLEAIVAQALDDVAARH